MRWKLKVRISWVLTLLFATGLMTALAIILMNGNVTYGGVGHASASFLSFLAGFFLLKAYFLCVDAVDGGVLYGSRKVRLLRESLKATYLVLFFFFGVTLLIVGWYSAHAQAAEQRAYMVLFSIVSFAGGMVFHELSQTGSG